MIRNAATFLAVASMTGVSAAAAGTMQCGSNRLEACRPIAASDELSSQTRRSARRPLRIEVRRPYVIEVSRPYFVPGPPAAMPPNYYLFVNGRLSGPYYY